MHRRDVLSCADDADRAQAMPGRAPSKRGVGLSFGPDVTQNFLDRNDLTLVVRSPVAEMRPRHVGRASAISRAHLGRISGASRRSHEVRDEGYEVEQGGRLVTVFSAQNYCDQMGNKGALLRFDSSMEYTVRQFDAVPHPPIRAMAYAGQMGGLFGL